MSFAEIICPACGHSTGSSSTCCVIGCSCYCAAHLAEAQSRDDAALARHCAAQDALLATVWLALTSGQRGSIKTNAREAMVTLARYMRQDGLISAGSLQQLETDNEAQRHRCPSSREGRRCQRNEGHKEPHINFEGSRKEKTELVWGKSKKE